MRANGDTTADERRVVGEAAAAAGTAVDIVVANRAATPRSRAASAQAVRPATRARSGLGPARARVPRPQHHHRRHRGDRETRRARCVTPEQAISRRAPARSDRAHDCTGTAGSVDETRQHDRRLRALRVLVRAHLLDDRLELGRARRLHVQQRVGVAGDGVRVDDVRQARRPSRECRPDSCGCGSRARRTLRSRRRPRRRRSRRGEPADHAVGDEPVDPAFDRRRRQPDLAPELAVGGARVFDE